MLAMSPFTDAPITRQDTVIEVVGRGTGGQPHDEVFVTTSITLAADIATEEIRLILPMSAEAAQKPLMRVVDSPITDAVQFDALERPEVIKELQDALSNLQQAEQAASQAVLDAVEKNAQGMGGAVLPIRPGQRDLRFFFSVAAPLGPDGSYSLQMLGPLASFVLQPGGSISVIGLLPRGARLVEANALQVTGDPGTALPESGRGEIAGRTTIGWLWQYDPSFTLRWTY